VGRVAAISFPDYRGSNQQRNYVLPLPYFIYRGDFLQLERDKMRGLLLKTDRLELEVSANGTVPVRSNKNPTRQGMPDLDPTLELGPSLNIFLLSSKHSDLTLKLPLRPVLASDFHRVRYVGVVSQPQLNLDVPMDNGWKLGIAVGPLFADRRYLQHVYGVDPAYATPGRRAYQTHGGYAGMQFVGAASKRFDQLWVAAFIKYDNLCHAAFADSPLVVQRSNLGAGIAVAWIFAQSKERVQLDRHGAKTTAPRD
jgi:MipA family protein